jgi:hypothetical protein
MSSPSSATENVPLYLRQVGRDLVLGPRRPPSAVRGASAKRVLVIGGGVTGLTSAWALLDAGFQVVVVSEQWAPATPRITSQIAGALCVPFFFSYMINQPIDGVLSCADGSGHLRCAARTQTASRSQNQNNGA